MKQTHRSGYRSGNRARLTAEEKQEQNRAALLAIVAGQSTANYKPIFEGFAAKGIPAEEIRPRENVFTFRAWKALQRHVRAGEKGVKVITWINADGKTDEGSEGDEAPSGYRFARSVTVFHISQTDPDEDTSEGGDA